MDRTGRVNQTTTVTLQARNKRAVQERLLLQTNQLLPSTLIGL